MKSFIWSLPEFIHAAIRFITGYVLVAIYEDGNYDDPPIGFFWKKWNDYVWEYLFQAGYLKK